MGGLRRRLARARTCARRPGVSAVPRIAAALGIAQEIAVVRASDDRRLGARTLASVVPDAWDLAGLSAQYRRFLRRFGKVIERFRMVDKDGLDPAQAFVVRTLLIHEYRRVLLRDPQLPASCCRSTGPAAPRTRCAATSTVSRTGRPNGTCWRRSGMRTAALPPASPAFYRRFGGLNDEQKS